MTKKQIILIAAWWVSIIGALIFAMWIFANLKIDLEGIQ